MDPKGRLTMDELRTNPWIKGSDDEIFSTTPLVTPDVLSLTRGSVISVQNQISMTMDAFHKAHRAGFRLQDVTNAPLARRRKMKNSSGSTDSSRSVTPVGSRNQSPCRLSPKHFVAYPSPLATEKKISPSARDRILPNPYKEQTAETSQGSVNAEVSRSSSSPLTFIVGSDSETDEEGPDFTPLFVPEKGRLRPIDHAAQEYLGISKDKCTPRQNDDSRSSSRSDKSRSASPSSAPTLTRNCSNFSLGFTPNLPNEKVDPGYGTQDHFNFPHSSTCDPAHRDVDDEVQQGKKRKFNTSTESGIGDSNENDDLDDCIMVEARAAPHPSKKSKSDVISID